MPAASNIFANSTASSSNKPPLPRKDPSGLTVIIGSLYSTIMDGAASLMACKTSNA